VNFHRPGIDPPGNFYFVVAGKHELFIFRYSKYGFSGNGRNELPDFGVSWHPKIWRLSTVNPNEPKYEFL
jgi:hypothetical protein